MGLQLEYLLGSKMALKFSLVLALAAVSTYGAVIPMEEDAVFDMVQSFLYAPEQFADALGMTRVKRSTFDRELHHDGLVEVGSFSVNGQKVDGKWATQIESKKTSAKNAKDIIPGFSLAMKSDYKTSANGVVSCSAGNKYSINIDRVPGKKIHAVIKGNGKTYVVDGVLDKAGRNIDVTIDANGKMIKANGVMTKTAKKYDVTVTAKYGKSDYKMAGLSVKMGDNVITSIELAGDMNAKKEGDKIVEIKNMKYLASVNIMGFDKMELKYGMQNGKKQTQKFVMNMKNMEKIEASHTRQLKESYGRDIDFYVKKGNEKLIQYHNEFTPSFTPTTTVSWERDDMKANAPFPSPVDTRVSANMNMA